MYAQLKTWDPETKTRLGAPVFSLVTGRWGVELRVQSQ